MSGLTTNYAVTDDLGGLHTYHAPISQVNTVAAPGFVKTIASPTQGGSYAKHSTTFNYGVPVAHHKVEPYNAPSSVVTYTGPGVHKTISYTAPSLVHKSSFTGPVVAYTAPANYETLSYVPAVHYRVSNPGFTKTFQTPYHSTVASTQIVPQAQKHIELGYHF